MNLRHFEFDGILTYLNLVRVRVTGRGTEVKWFIGGQVEPIQL